MAGEDSELPDGPPVKTHAERVDIVDTVDIVIKTFFI